ncbi:MAG: hypothetical protein SGJ20_19295 [Planctomycetota bacterium]|nr:hypothetical protein [Planctomycetota bacterium]
MYCNAPAEQCFGLAGACFLLADNHDQMAVTDSGKSIPLHCYELILVPSDNNPMEFNSTQELPGIVVLLEEVCLANLKRPSSFFVRLEPAMPGCNCHGWTFAEGQHCIHDKDVPQILQDNGYRQVTEPMSGDLAVCYNDNVIIHSGLVRSVRNGEVIRIESKWGPFGVFLHHPQAYPHPWTYYRSERRGHRLEILSKTH